MENVVIEPVCNNNISVAKEIIKSCFDTDRSSELDDCLIKRNLYYYFMLCIGGAPVGLAGVLISDDIEIISVCVLKNMRGRGYGKMLLSHIVSFAKSKGKNRVLLEVNKNNASAIRLYEKFGFKKIAERKKYYGNDDAIIYEFRLHIS